MFFYVMLAVIIMQRLLELVIAKRNEKQMLKQGAIEIGSSHYKWIVLMHSLFFVSLASEVLLMRKQLSSIWAFLFTAFIMIQIGRVWVMTSLGRFWNTKIIVLPEAEVILKGPYKFLKHPNYVIVALEFLVIPLFFEAYITMVLFSLLNLFVLSIRIPIEEKALCAFTDYDDKTKQHARFWPVKK
jgi:methyltransferase